MSEVDYWRGYGAAMEELKVHFRHASERNDMLTKELLKLDNRRKREVHAASESARIYAAASTSRWADAKAEALRDAADSIEQVDGRKDDAVANWLRARADVIEGEKA